MNEFKGLNYCFEYKGATVYQTADFDGLPGCTKKHLQPQLVAAAEEGFARPHTDAFAQDVQEHIRGGDLYVIEQGGSARGFALLQRHPALRAVYIGGVVKSPEAPSRIIETVVAEHLKATGAQTITVRTQNDRVAEIICAVADQVVAIDRLASQGEHDLLAQMGLLPNDDSFDRGLLIARGYYGGAPMIQGRPRRRSSVPKIRNFTDNLRYDQGDAALFIGHRRSQ